MLRYLVFTFNSKMWHFVGVNDINQKAKNITAKLGIDERVYAITEKEAFFTMKDHKDNFNNQPKCRLINPTKSNLGKISKIMLENINGSIKEQLKVNQWRNTIDVLKWFNTLPDRKSLTFICFDIVQFYPSITQELLGKALKFASNYCNITADDEHIIMSTKK